MRDLCKYLMKTFLFLAAATLGTLQQCSEPELFRQSELHRPSLPLSKIKPNKAISHGRQFKIVPMYLGDFSVSVGASSRANIQVSWGDGTDTSYVMTDNLTYLDHTYSNTSQMPEILVTGDLTKIIYFQTEYGSGTFADIDFKPLTNLQEVQIDLTSTPAEIDLSQNRSLTKLSIGAVPELQSILLPKRHNISIIGIDGPSGLNTQDVDAIIGNIYANAVAKNIKNGAFSVTSDWQNDEGDLTMLGPPSSFSIEKLRSLRDDYAWTIYPELQ